MAEYLGLAREIPLLKAMRFSTILAYSLVILTLFRGGAAGLMGSRQMKLLLAFIAFTTLSVIWAVVQTYAFTTIRDFVDGAVLFVLAATLVNSQRRINQLSWTCLLIVLVLILRNLNTLGDASRSMHFKAGPFLGDGNDFAWGLVVFLPIILNLALSQKHFVYKSAGLVGGIICILGVIGTGSRGGSLALMAAYLYFWLFESQQKLRTALVLLVASLAVVLIAPQGYISRMKSLDDTSQDSSAQARLQTWRGGMKMAVDFPLGVGAGNFAPAYGRFYIPNPEDNRIAWAGGRWLSAHSIYFRTLGEYGFLGVALLLWLIVGSLRDNFTLRNELRRRVERGKVHPIWPSMLNMSLVGFAICGVFLGGLTYPHIFLLTGLTVAAQRAAALVDEPAPARRRSARTTWSSPRR